ncbi:MAG TPA: hypothetical protein VHK26_10945 [Methyloceanibacter sp.]|nr:hypothetical protein [Methyloceanibacter sp.]
MSIRSAALGMALLVAAAMPAVAEDKPEAQSAPAEPQWTEFQSTERGFSVSFPGTPKTTSAPVEGQNPLLQYDFQVSVGDDTVYSVVVFEYPEGKGPNPDTDSYLKLVNAYAKGSESRLRKRGPATIDGRSGFEAIADDSKSKLSHLVDVVPAGDRIYMLVTAGPKGHATSDNAVRFRDSFHVLDGDSGSQPAHAASSPAAP